MRVVQRQPLEDSRDSLDLAIDSCPGKVRAGGALGDHFGVYAVGDGILDGVDEPWRVSMGGARAQRKRGQLTSGSPRASWAACGRGS